MIICGIDPGQTGGIAIVNDDAHDVSVAVMPDSVLSFIAFMRAVAPSHVWIEKAQAMPKNGVVSMFRYGLHFGELIGAISALGYPHTQVRPWDWCRAMHIGASGGSAKCRSLETARRLFPHVDLRGGPKAKKPHAGIVDALLIAEYGRRQLRFGEIL